MQNVYSPKKLIYAEMFLLRYWLWRASIHAGWNLHLKKNMHVVNLNIHNITTNKLRFHFSEDFQRADITTKGNPLVICCCCDLVQPCNRSTLYKTNSARTWSNGESQKESDHPNQASIFNSFCCFRGECNFLFAWFTELSISDLIYRVSIHVFLQLFKKSS